MQLRSRKISSPTVSTSSSSTTDRKIVQKPRVRSSPRSMSRRRSPRNHTSTPNSRVAQYDSTMHPKRTHRMVLRSHTRR